MGQTVKIWEDAGDDRVCDICKGLDRRTHQQAIAMNQGFGFKTRLKINNPDIDLTPPAHPHCRCVVVYKELSAPDFRASERAFQLMMQVAGRAGRHNDRGRVFIQTAQPKHPVIQFVASGDYHGMARVELAERRSFGYPPYSHLVRLLLRCEDYDLLRHASHYVAGLMRQKFGGRVMGPVSSALEILRGEHRSEVLLKIEVGASMQRARGMIVEVVKALSENKEYKGVKIVVDVDSW
jgi:primosomal protein N'